MDYFHPLTGTKSFANTDIVLVDDLNKAKRAAGIDGVVMKATVKNGRIFDLNDPLHKDILQQLISPENFARIINNNKLDWNELDLIFNNKADDADEVLTPNGFIGLTYSRGGDDFILIFNRKNVDLGDIVWSSPLAKSPLKSIPKIPKINEIVAEVVHEELNNLNKEIGFMQLNGERFYHQTNRASAENIVQNGFVTSMHDGQARYTHGIYFLKHSEGRYGDTTLAAEISGKFIDLTDDPFGDEWIALQDSVEWNNHVDLTVKLREKYSNADGIVFANKYLLVVWYPDRSIKNVQIL